MTSAERSLPLVTIVTPSYNQGPFIRDTIESVLGQNYPAIEYLVMDAGSTDQTLDILREYGDRLTWVSEPDHGPAHAINKGWGQARGSVLLWINSDDLLLPGAVSAAVHELQRNPKVVGVYGPGIIVDREGNFAADWPVPPICPADVLLENDPFLQPATYIRTDAFARIGPLDERLNWTMDWDLFLRLLADGPMARVDQPLAAWRRHDDSRTQSGGVRRVWEIWRTLRRFRAPLSAPAYRLHASYSFMTALERASRRGPSFLRSAAGRLLRGPGWRWHERLSCGGRFPDGWAGPRVRWRAQGTGSTLEIAGLLNTVQYPSLRGQILAVSINGTRVKRTPLSHGAFELQIALPDTATHSPLIEVRANRTFVPARIWRNGDTRRLSYELQSLRLT